MTDGGLETTLIFHDGFDLPEFAAVDLLRSEAGTEALGSYYARYAELARELQRQYGFSAPDAETAICKFEEDVRRPGAVQ